MIRSTKIQYQEGTIDALSQDLSDLTITKDMPLATFIRAGGFCHSKSVQLTGVGASTENLFEITGIVRLLGLYGICTAVGDSTVFSSVKFELDDGTDQEDLTTAVDASGIVTNGLLLKENDKDTPLDFFNPTTIKQVANVSKDVYDPVIILQKTGDVSSYIRLSYTGDIAEGETPTDVTINFFARWSPLSESSKLEAVA